MKWLYPELHLSIYNDEDSFSFPVAQISEEQKKNIFWG